MGDELRRIRIVLVAFRVDRENSIDYVKLNTPTAAKLGEVLNRMFHDGRADFVSVRAIGIREPPRGG